MKFLIILNSKIRHTEMDGNRVETRQRHVVFLLSAVHRRHPRILGSRRHETRNKRTFFDYSDFVKMGFLDITLVVHSHRRCIVSERAIWGQEPKERNLGRRHWLDDITDAMDVSTRVGLYSRVRLFFFSYTHTHTHTFDHAHFLNGISTYYSMQHCSVHSIRFSSSLFSMFLIFYVLSSLSYHFSIFS